MTLRLAGSDHDRKNKRKRPDNSERPTCRIPGCKSIACRPDRLCSSHERRKKKYGNPLAGPPIRQPSPVTATTRQNFTVPVSYIVEAAEAGRDINRIIGENVRRAREEAGLSQWRLEKMTGISRSIIWRIENGYGTQISYIGRIAFVLKVPVWSLFEPPWRKQLRAVREARKGEGR